jgi:hypothetical protein
MVASVVAWDIETVPDIKGFAAANGHDGKSNDETAMGGKFPEHIHYSITCIGAKARLAQLVRDRIMSEPGDYSSTGRMSALGQTGQSRIAGMT